MRRFNRARLQRRAQPRQPRAASPAGGVKEDETEEEKTGAGPGAAEDKRQLASVNKARQAASAVRAVELERRKQQLRNVAKATNLTYAQVKALHSHFQTVLEPCKTENLAQTLAQDSWDHGQLQLQQELAEDLRGVARDFEASFFSGDHPFPYDGSADKLNRDADNLTFENYVQGLLQVARHGRPEDRLLLLFQVVDRDGDGAVSHPELMELLASHCETEERQETIYTWVKRHFWEADKDRNGVLDFYECLAILRKHPSILTNITFKIDAYIDQLQRTASVTAPPLAMA